MAEKTEKEQQETETKQLVLTEDQKKQRIGELVRLAKTIQKWVDKSESNDKKSALIGVSMYIQNRIKFLSGKIQAPQKTESKKEELKK